MHQTNQVHTLLPPQRVHIVSVVIVLAAVLELAGVCATYAVAQHIADEVHVIARVRHTISTQERERERDVYTVVVDTTLRKVSVVR